MSRMLDALKRIEAKSREPGETSTSADAAEAGPLPESVQESNCSFHASEAESAFESPKKAASRDTIEMSQLLASIPRQAATFGPEHGEPEHGEPEQGIAEQVVERVDLAAVAIENMAAARTTGPRQIAWPDSLADEYGRSCGRLADKLLSQWPTDRPTAALFTSPHDDMASVEMGISLAVALARKVSGQVVVVDGNLREPRMTECLRAGVPRGLADVLADGSDWRKVIRETTIPGLKLLPGIRPTGDGSQTIDLSRTQKLLEELRGTYRITLVNTAAATHLDVLSTVQYYDRVYLLMRLNETPRRTARQAAKLINQRGGRLAGSIVVE